MKAINVEISNYKSIGQECNFNLYNKSTVIVGKSNVGKTNILKAIQAAFNDNRIVKKNRCSWKNDTDDDVSSKIWFEMDSNDRKRLKDVSSVLSDRQRIILTKYLGGKRSVSFEPPFEIKSTQIPTTTLIEYLSKIRLKTRKILRNWEKVKSIHSMGESDVIVKHFEMLDKWVNEEKILNPQKGQKEQNQFFTKFSKKISTIRQQINSKKYRSVKAQNIRTGLHYLEQSIDEHAGKLKFRVQRVKPFEEKDIIELLPNIVYIESDESYRVEDRLQFDKIDVDSNEFINLLLAISKVDIEPLLNGDRRERKETIEKINYRLKSNLAKYWNQEKIIIELSDDVEETEGRDGDVFIDKYLEVDIKGAEGHRGSISDQGPGFQWFLWFVVNHMINKKSSRNYILIMDEPGLHLHASAQYDLLDRFENTSDNIQIIYTTHSPYLIDKNYPHRVLSVNKDSGNKENIVRGSYINNKPYHSSNGVAWEPIRSAIGLPIGASLFVGGHNLIVEGITDQMFICAIIRSFIRTGVNCKYDLNKVSVNFGGDEANTIALATFCNQESSSVKILMDSDTSTKKINKLKKAKFPADRIYVIGEVMKDNKKFIDIEHLFSDEYYHESFKKTYEELKLETVSNNNMPKTWYKVFKEFEKKDNWGRTKYYEQYFKNNMQTSFSKISVARTICEEIATMSKEDVEKELSEFKTLLDKLWFSAPVW